MSLAKMHREAPARVAVIAAQAVSRGIVKSALESREGLTVTGTYGGVEQAIKLGKGLNPDVWIVEACFDATALAFSQTGVVVSFGFHAGAGADVTIPTEREEMPAALDKLCRVVRKRGEEAKRAASVVRKRPRSVLPAGLGGLERVVIAIGASSGAPPAVREVIAKLPSKGPAVLLAQHIGPSHLPSYVRMLQRRAAVQVDIAIQDEELKPGRVYVAPADAHLTVRRANTSFRVNLDDRSPKMNGHRPSVDVLMSSMAVAVGRFGVGVVLSGLGNDGADGLLAMRLSGARTFVQDEWTAAVPAMPKACIANGAAEKAVAVDRIAPTICSMVAQLLPRRMH